MTRSFYSCDRDQELLLPHNLAEWIPEDDLARVVVEAVSCMNLRLFFNKYKDGRGQTAYRPDVLLALLLLAYCQGERSSRRIEKLCYRDISYRFITGQCFPDHSTIARFRNKFRAELKGLFLEVLELCRAAGLVKVGIVAIDGTKIGASAAMDANQRRAKLASQVELMLSEAEQVDQSENETFGEDKRGDELPEELRSAASRRAAFRAAKDRQDRIRKAHEKVESKVREKTKAYNNKVAKQKEREAKTGKKASKQEEPKPPDPDTLNAFKANTTDPDSSTMKGRHGYLQGYNAQAAACEGTHIIVATHVTSTGCDTKELHGMVQRVISNLDQVLGPEHGSPTGINADAGYWSHKALKSTHAYLESRFESQVRPQLYVAVPPRYAKIAKDPPADNSPPPGASLVVRLEYLQRSPQGQQIYKTRSETIEPIFGTIKDERGCNRFMQRGLEKVDAEWSLMCTTHNLLKLWRHKTAQMN